MDREDLLELMSLIAPAIAKQTTNMRDLTLAVTFSYFSLELHIMIYSISSEYTKVQFKIHTDCMRCIV